MSREQFEKEAEKEGLDTRLICIKDGRLYASLETELAWKFYQSGADQFRKDAERYRWLRKQYWNEADIAVVREPRKSVKLGFDCPTLERLDDYIDAAIEEKLNDQ